MPTSPSGTMPNRYSSPICAPESRPNRLPATSPALALRGCENRCVTRNALLNCGTRSDVGRLISVKSGSAGFRLRSSSAAVTSCTGGWAAAACGDRIAAATIAASQGRRHLRRMPLTNDNLPAADDDLVAARGGLRRLLKRHVRDRDRMLDVVERHL